MKKIYIQPVITIEPLEEDDFLMVSEPTVPKRTQYIVGEDDDNVADPLYDGNQISGDIGVAGDDFWIE